MKRFSVNTPEEPVPNAGQGSTTPFSPARHTTILTVEDDETVCWIMGKVLETHGYRTLAAMNADDAWKLWRQNIHTIKLVITDINMPGGPNGVALGHAIQDEDGSVPVIYTSGHRAVHEFAELRAGANYLAKPFRMDELLDIIARALAGQESRGIGAVPSTLVT